MKLNKIKEYLSLVKFAHTIFAMPFALIGFFIAIRTTTAIFEWKILIFIILCMILARNAAMSFNRYLDRNIDIKNPRTAKREVAAGTISAKSALLFVIINSVLFILITFFINKLVFFLSPVALLVILGYSYTKRFTSLCHIVLGIGLSLAPIGAYLSVTGKFALLPIIYSFIVLFWVSGFDIIYALQDEEFDKSQKLKSIPVLLGKKSALILSLVLHLLSAVLCVFGGYLINISFADAGLNSGFLYWIGAFIFIGLLIYQHLLVKPNDLRKVNLAFFTTNGIASIVFALFTILHLFF